VIVKRGQKRAKILPRRRYDIIKKGSRDHMKKNQQCFFRIKPAEMFF
jgi:hypothetical protein